MMRRIFPDRKALSPVIGSIILLATVLVLGMAAWSYTYSTSSVLRVTYFAGVQGQIDAVSERFTVEHVAYAEDELRVWVFNHGVVNIMVDVYARGDAEGGNTAGTTVAAGELAEIVFPLTAQVGEEFAITVMSRRQNLVYATYVIPSTTV